MDDQYICRKGKLWHSELSYSFSLIKLFYTDICKSVMNILKTLQIDTAYIVETIVFSNKIYSKFMSYKINLSPGLFP